MEKHVVIGGLTVILLTLLLSGCTIETPSIQFVKDNSEMTLTVAQIDPAVVLWICFKVVNSTGTYSVTVFNTALKGFVKAGDTLYFTESDTYKIIFLPTNTLIGEWTFP
jgi:hypothetical protein